MAKLKYNKGDKVRVTKRDGEVLEGVVRDADYNLCTFKPQYCVDYEQEGHTWTMMCVPESAIGKVTAV